MESLLFIVRFSVFEHCKGNTRQLGSDFIYLSADFPGVMEEVVQKVYGNSPVLFINGAAGDMHPALRRTPLDFADTPREHYEQMRAQLRWREIQRIGRVFGGEVCKVLAELEVAGETLAARCDRWGYVEFEKQPTGLLISEPAFILKSRTVVTSLGNYN